MTFGRINLAQVSHTPRELIPGNAYYMTDQVLNVQHLIIASDTCCHDRYVTSVPTFDVTVLSIVVDRNTSGISFRTHRMIMNAESFRNYYEPFTRVFCE